MLWFHNERFLMACPHNLLTTSSRGLLGGWLIPGPGKACDIMLRPIQADFGNIVTDTTQDTPEEYRKRMLYLAN